ncbi:FtsZ-binding cell division protein ZapB [Microbacterium endophyticum]|uniref:FtsZ-binding cell division protein ZapB n=2 Tax=Microbacterium endophyticum TaxID=1526412 RepID=A0A7W4V2T2_9MICO|nr:plasmid recombination protein [Microbacterium endophyticum]MBB2975123.1 FtsZ-binding cell division protein ZapB [Microbacterium endophyticum]NIK37337.1 FtsZ-binding cell division protein ZapB [Microbacterium endophyticum]
MSYTMTFDVSHKVGRGGHAKNFFRHIARDADQKAGFHFSQSNPNIVSERTVFNLTRVNDGQGGVRRLESVAGRPPSDELDEYLKERLSTVQRALRKDAVLMRGVILQLDPKWFDDHNADWREEGPSKEAYAYMGAALDWVVGEFGADNIVGFSVHLDEVNPQIQVAIVPISADGRLSQKDFFKGPSDLKRQHMELRAAVSSAGYDVEYRVTERSREHLSSSEFQRKADWLKDAASAIKNEQQTNKSTRHRLTSRASKLDERETEIVRRERELAAHKATAELAIREATESRHRAQQAQHAADQARKDADAERERMRDLSARLEHVPADVDRWLDKVKIGQKPLRDLFNADMRKARTLRREVIGLMGRDDQPAPKKDFDRER